MDANLLPILLSFTGFVLVVIGFTRLVKSSKSEALSGEPVTVVLPFRNEELHHKLMLERLKYTSLQPQDLWMFVDDGSKINWKPELPEFASVYSLSDQGGSKKIALQYAIQRSESPLICTTDADCHNQARWIQSMRQACTSTTNVVIGPVLMVSGHSLVSQLAAMESLALLAVTMGTAGLKIPLMCSGANLLFRKSSWQDIGGYSDHINQASGDDVLLMHSIWFRNPKSVDAQVDIDALVKTEAPQSWQDFFHQRKRWASKSGHVWHYKKILLSILMGIWAISPWFLWAFSWPMFFTLMAAEVLWMYWITQFYKRPFSLGSWFVFRLFYPFLFVVLPFVPPGKWKPT
jgi:cellulose synthase/poly-beta-1,6-N-acetylglucosamine synthase-like glycosyltransferase